MEKHLINNANIRYSLFVSQPYYVQKTEKIGILDWISEKYNQTNNFGNEVICITDDGKEDTVNINLVIYKYTVIINKDPDYVLKCHIKATPMSNNNMTY
ncbi:MAG: hypothetical protein P0116_09410 [Candidatus Nitrosocosmicus sp.]|nr:hypothetical protein [Candidatus Nitrosocosmicus sp.]